MKLALIRGMQLYRKLGYALRGVRPVCQRLLCRGQRINAVAAISTRGVVATDMTLSTINGEFFFDYLRGTLLPQMKPLNFDGQNPQSILVLDNCSIQEVKDIVQQAGILLMFLPVYSPDVK